MKQILVCFCFASLAGCASDMTDAERQQWAEGLGALGAAMGQHAEGMARQQPVICDTRYGRVECPRQ